MTEQLFQIPPGWHGKPYYSLDAWCKNTYGEKCYKIALDAGFSCPNRDGTLGSGGCIFCSAGGSGEFAVEIRNSDLSTQLQKGLSLFHDKKVGTRFIAYFQAYTNTYGPIKKLRRIYETALQEPEVCGISIATRPDCVGEDVCALLSELKEKYTDKFIWVELGLQTIHDATARFIHRGYELSCFEDTFQRLSSAGIPMIVHVILGLPGELEKDVQYTIDKVVELAPDSLTVHSLAIKRASHLSKWIQENGVETLRNTDATMEIATKGAQRLGMEPYYLYRQKNMSGNFENVGYAKPGKYGLYNILIMEERQTIVALGAGSITKVVWPDGRIERCDNVKDVKLYIEKLDEMLERKETLFGQRY